MAGDENDRHALVFGEVSLEVQSIQIWQFDVEDQAGWSVDLCPAQEVLTRAKRFHAPSSRADQRRQCFTDRDIIIDDEDDRLWLHDCSRRLASCEGHHEFLRMKHEGQIAYLSCMK